MVKVLLNGILRAYGYRSITGSITKVLTTTPATAEVAAVGGIGIDASNTDISSGKPSYTIEQAGIATTEGANRRRSGRRW